MGVWRIRVGNACVSLELSLFMTELVSPVTLKALHLPLVRARSQQYVVCLLLKHLHSWRKEHPSSYSFYSFWGILPLRCSLWVFSVISTSGDSV